MHERRAVSRRKAEGELLIYDELIDHPLGLVSDMTAMGCRLKATFPVKVGKLVQCRLILPEPIFGNPDISFLGQIMWCTESDTPDEFELGLEFQSLTSRERMVLSLLIVPWDEPAPAAQPPIAAPEDKAEMVFEERKIND